MHTIFIGPLGGGKEISNGASVKNYHIVKKLKKYLPSLKILDTENWKSKPWKLVQLFWLIVTNNKQRFILSLNSKSANKVIRLIELLAPKAQIVYWVIGGQFGKMIEDKIFSPRPYSKIKNIIVEGVSMKRQLAKGGINNVMVMPNFKEIPSYSKCKIANRSKLKFVFLSRIIPQKGCDLIIDAVRELNTRYPSDEYLVDFYGPIAQDYKERFISSIETIPNISYKGFLDLTNPENYSTLSSYSAMLFPTYWTGEGCPGVVIDAYLASLPVLASDWNLNKDYIRDNETGMIFSAKDINSLITAMDKVLNKRYILEEFAKNIEKEKDRFNIDKVLSESNLKKYYIMD